MHETNLERAGWARNALDTFGRETYGGETFMGSLAKYEPDEIEQRAQSDAYTMIQDLIGDLLHLTVEAGWDPEEMLLKAKDYFDYENAPGYEGD